MNTRTILYALLLAVLGGGNFANAEDFGDWIVDVHDPDVLSMATVNDSDRVFGQFCSLEDGSCMWLIHLAIACQKGDTYPVLANWDSGAVYLELQCNGQLKESGYVYGFTNFDQVDKLVRQSKRVSFAFPMQEDEFQVVRFNLRGATTALSAIQDAAGKHPAPAPRNTRDQRL